MMTPEFFEQVVAMPEYDFLQTNPHLGKNIMFLTLGGSYAYGTMSSVWLVLSRLLIRKQTRRSMLFENISA